MYWKSCKVEDGEEIHGCLATDALAITRRLNLYFELSELKMNNISEDDIRKNSFAIGLLMLFGLYVEFILIITHSW